MVDFSKWRKIKFNLSTLLKNRICIRFKAIFMGQLDSIEAFSRKKNADEDTTEEAEKFKFQKKRFNANLTETSDYLSMKQFLIKDFKQLPLLIEMGLKIENLMDK